MGRVMPRLTAISGFDAKGPACFLLEMGGRRLLLDLGEGPDDNRRPDLRGIGPVDAVLLSHGHADHAGALDLLPDVPVFATAPVRALLQGLPAGGALPRRGMTRIAGLEVETGASGHAPGAVWMRIGGVAGLLYTGDMSDEGALYPCDTPPRAAALVADASYGAGDGALADQRGDFLALAAGGPLLLPAPQGGRGLEMALEFAAAGYRVALCPDHRRIAGVLASHTDWLRPDGAQALAAVLASASRLTADSAAQDVMIVAGPNAENGLAARLAPRFAAEGSARVVFSGHLGRGTPAEAMVAAGKAVWLRWNVHPRLSALRDLLVAVKPAQAMAAFTPTAGRLALAAAAPGPWVDAPVMQW